VRVQSGLELAGASPKSLTILCEHDFRRIRPQEARIILWKAAARSPPYPEDLSA